MKRIKIVDNAENEDVEESDEEEEIVDVVDGDLEVFFQQKAKEEAKIIAEIERLRVMEARIAEARWKSRYHGGNNNCTNKRVDKSG